MKYLLLLLVLIGCTKVDKLSEVPPELSTHFIDCMEELEPYKQQVNPTIEDECNAQPLVSRVRE